MGWRNSSKSSIADCMTMLNDFPLFDCLQLIRSENVGPVTFFKLVERFGSPRAALERLPEMAKKGGMKRPIQIAPRDKIEKEISLTEKFGARFIRYGEADYPKLLEHIHSAPPVLIVRGNSHLWQEGQKCVAMVGSRNASAAGQNLTKKFAKECGERGLTVVSGLARGIDSNAHQGALATGTVGVIAGGIDNVYPPENKMLFDAMAEQGAIVSEQMFSTSPQAKNFPARNRIIAGMCAGLLVVEAAPKSGSLITAKYALEQDREVMAIPGSPMDPRSSGANGLIKDGAALVQSVEDILQVLQRPLQLAEANQTSFEFESAAEPQEDELEEARQRVLSLLSPVPTEIDELARQSQISLAILQQVLLELELANRLNRGLGGKVALTTMDEESQGSMF